MNNQLPKNPPKLIASDLDGTLLDSSAALSDQNKDAVAKIVKNGTLFVPCTGRALYEITKEVRDLEGVRYLITSNGAKITDKVTGNSIDTLICKEDFKKIFEIMRAYAVCITIHHDGVSYVDENLITEEKMSYFNISEYYKGHLRKTNAKMPFFNDYFEQEREVEMVCGFFKHENELRECQEKLSKIPSLFVTASASGSIEILSAKATKGNALIKLSQDLLIDIKDVVAVGDSPNDLTMIRVAGLGIATANAKDEVKAQADRIICSNNEHVADYLLKELF